MGLYRQKKSPYWWMSYRDENGKRVQKSTKVRAGTKKARKEAEKILAIHEAEVAKGLHGIRRDAPLLSEEIDRYLNGPDSANLTPGGRERYECFAEHLKAFFKGKRIDRIRPTDIHAFRASRGKGNGKGVSNTTVNKNVSFLRRVCNVALENGRITKNPVKAIKFLKEPDPKENILTPEDEQKLLNHAAPHLRPVLIVLTDTGLRKGDLRNLKWENIDLKENLIRMTTRKTGRDVEIPLTPRVVEVLNTLPQRSEHVFTKEDGKPIGDFVTAFRGAKRRAGIKKLRVHDLRHTFGSRTSKHADPFTVQKLMGHSSVTTTQRYAHSTRKDLRDAIAHLDGLTAPNPPDSNPKGESC